MVSDSDVLGNSGLPQDLQAVHHGGSATLRVIKSDSTALVLKYGVHNGPPGPIYSLRAGPNNTFWRVPLDDDVVRAIRTPIKVHNYLHIYNINIIIRNIRLLVPTVKGKR